jgi:ABC-2 type transport system ATP-binding protein
VVDLKARGKTVIFSTHLMDNAERLCDAVCIIARGDKVLDGPVSAVKAAHGGKVVALSVAGDSRSAIAHILADPTLVSRVDDQNRFYEINLAAGADPQQLLRRVLETGAPIQRFELVQPSLHQIFLEKVGASGVEEGMSGQG